MLLERAILGELRKADGDATTNGLGAVKDGSRGCINDFPTSGVFPAGDMSAKVVDGDLRGSRPFKRDCFHCLKLRWDENGMQLIQTGLARGVQRDWQG